MKHLFTLLSLLLLLPVAAWGQETTVAPDLLVVGNITVDVSNSGYWTTDADGMLTESDQNNWNINYDASTNILTLKNAKIQGVSDTDYGAGIRAKADNSKTGALNIVLEGENEVLATSYNGAYNTLNSAGIYCRDCKLNIDGKGSGSLNIQAAECGKGDRTAGIYSLLQVTITNATVNIKSGKAQGAAGSFSEGIFVFNEGVTITNSTVVAEGLGGATWVSGIKAGNGSGLGIYITNSHVTVTAGANEGTVSSRSSTGLEASYISIEGSTVYAIADQGDDIAIYGSSYNIDGSIVFMSDGGYVFGDAVLTEDLVIEEDESLTVETGTSLTVSNGVTLTNNGKIINDDGTITNSGTIIVNGELIGDVNVEGGSIPITGIMLDETELSLNDGENNNTVSLTATVKPTITTETEIWSSSDENVVKVENGTVTVVAVGEATITVKSPSNDKIFATCKVTVVHKSITHTPAKVATCTEDGNIAYWYCDGCGKYFKDANATEEITLKETIIKATGHTEELVGAKEATCTEDGYTGDKICTVCKTVLEEGTVIPATGHHYVNGTCTECGEKDPDYRPDPISYYNIYVEDVCEGVDITTSKNVVREGGTISLYVEKDTANYTFDNFQVYYKRSYYGPWEVLEEGVQPGEYPIRNIWTHIYIKAEGAEEKEDDPTGIEEITGVKVYTKDGSLYVQTPQRETVIIVSMTGAVVKNEEQVGLKQYHGLQPGIYIVRVGQTAYKIRLH